MDQPGFEQFLQTRRLSVEQIAQHVATVAGFETFLNGRLPPLTLEQADAAATQAFVDQLIAQGANTWDNLVTVARYGRFIKNNVVYVAILELLDGGEAMEGMYRKVGEVVGAERRDAIFAGLELPPLGLANRDKARLTRTVMERLGQLVDAETCRQIFSDSFRELPEAGYLEDKKRYWEIGNFDQFLELKRQENIAQLEELQATGGLYFSQEITPEVVEFVRSNPEIAIGVREGNILYVTKIPYQAKDYLAATDPDLKRYYYCHCPWARESLRRGETPVSAKFCQCSAGFHKKPWEVIFGQPIETEVLESVLKGDLRCRFALHLPLEE